MNTSRLLGAILAAGLGVSTIIGGGDAFAQKKPKASSGQTAVVPRINGNAALSPRTLRWGMSYDQAIAAYERVIDEDYKPRYKDVSPGVQMQRLDAAVVEAKNELRRGRINFGKLPTTIDATPLKGEYTYNNDEAMLTVTRGTTTRHLFFIQDKLWKIIDDLPLGEKADAGKTYIEAVTKLAKRFGVAGKVTPADPDKGVYGSVVEWKDARSHIRALERSDESYSLAFEDSDTLARIDSLRPNKPVDNDAIDPDVASIFRKPDAPPGPPPGAGKK